MSSNQDISIQDVTALQILPNRDSSTLAKGKLSVISTPNDSKDETVLILSVGPTMSFPLTNKTLFGTFHHRPNVFAFQLPQNEADFNVQIHLPNGIQDPLHPANADFTRLENLLIEKGLLLTGIRAAGNEIASGIREGTQRSTQAISKTANERSSTINDKVSIDPNTHSIAQRAAESTATAAAYTSSLATSIGSIASKGGETIGRGVRDLGEQTGLYNAGGNKDQIRDEDKSFDKKEESGIWSDTKSAASEAGGAISQGASSLGNSIAQASEKTLGSDFNRLASKTGEAAKNSGKTVLNAFESTSMIYAGGNAAAGTSKAMKGDANEASKKNGEGSVIAE